MAASSILWLVNAGRAFTNIHTVVWSRHKRRLQPGVRLVLSGLAIVCSSCSLYPRLVFVDIPIEVYRDWLANWDYLQPRACRWNTYSSACIVSWSMWMSSLYYLLAVADRPAVDSCAIIWLFVNITINVSPIRHTPVELCVRFQRGDRDQ